MAFVVGSPPEPEPRARLRDVLPPPLIPAVFHFAPTLPLLHNGKADRTRLAALASTGQEDR